MNQDFSSKVRFTTQPPIPCFLSLPRFPPRWSRHEPQFPTSGPSRHYKLSWIAHQSILSLRDWHFWEVVFRGDQLHFSSGTVVFTFYKIRPVGCSLFSYMRFSPITTAHGLFDDVVLFQHQGSFFYSGWTFKQLNSGYVEYYDRMQWWRGKRDSTRKLSGRSRKSRFI